MTPTPEAIREDAAFCEMELNGSVISAPRDCKKKPQRNYPHDQQTHREKQARYVQAPRR